MSASKHYHSVRSFVAEQGLGSEMGARHKMQRAAARRPKKIGNHWNNEPVWLRVDRVDGVPTLFVVNPQMGAVPMFMAVRDGQEPPLKAKFDGRPWLITKVGD